MIEPNHFPALSREELLALVSELQRQRAEFCASAVIARKVSQCSKNRLGAEAFAAFISVIRTLMKTHPGSVVESLPQLLRPPPSQHVHPESSSGLKHDEPS
jgi:hypothetical protein